MLASNVREDDAPGLSLASEEFEMNVRLGCPDNCTPKTLTVAELTKGDGIFPRNTFFTAPVIFTDSPNVDVILAIDSSGSMGFNDPSNNRLTAARNYLTASVNGDFVGVVDFDRQPVQGPEYVDRHLRRIVGVVVLPDQNQEDVVPEISERNRQKAPARVGFTGNETRRLQESLWQRFAETRPAILTLYEIAKEVTQCPT